MKRMKCTFLTHAMFTSSEIGNMRLV